MSRLLLLLLLLVDRSTSSCSIFPRLNCSCFHSNTSSASSMYSHLYCQGRWLNATTFTPPFSSDYVEQHSFQTISFDFDLDGSSSVEISSDQFLALGKLFSSPLEWNGNVEFRLRLTGMSQIRFARHSIRSSLFGETRRETSSFVLHLSPSTSNDTEIDIDDQFDFAEDCFSGLFLSRMKMSIHTKNDYFPRRLSFERLFNHTTIGRLELFGSLIVPSSNDSFDGDIRSLIVHRHVDVVDANSYPAYSRVLSLTIHSLGAHSMDLTSFLPRHRNLRGLELLEPRFDVSIDQFLPSLDSLTIDVEEFDRRTVLAARHIHHLKFGSRLRRVDGEVFSPTFFRRLHQLDFSLVNLSQLTTDTQCQLSDYLATNLHQRVNFVFPSLNNLTDECLCSQMFLLDVLFQRRDPICAKQCRFNDCPRIRDYFREKYPLVIEPEKNLLPAIEFVADPIDEHLMQFLVNQTTTENNLNGISTLDNLQKYNEILSADPTESIERKETTTTDSTPWLYLCLAFAAFLLVLFLLLLLIFRVRRKYQSKPLPVYL